MPLQVHRPVHAPKQRRVDPRGNPCSVRFPASVLRIAISGFALMLPVAALAQDGEQRASGAAILRGAAEAGLGGPQSVGAQLEEDAAQRRTMSRRPGVDALFDPVETSLERLQEISGLQVGLNYQALYQSATDSLTNQDQVSSGSVIYRLLSTCLVCKLGVPPDI